MLGLPAQKAFFSCAALFGIAEAGGLEGGAVFDHGIEDAGQLVGGGGDGRFGSELGADAAEPVAQCGLGSMKRLGRHAQGGGESVADLAGVGGEGAPSGDAVVGAKPQPRGEVFGGGELADIGADFTEERQGGLDAHSLHGGEIDPELVKEVLAHRFVHLLGGLLRGRRWWALTLVIEGIHALLDLLFAVGHEALVEAPCLEGLTQGEEVFLAPVAVQGFGNLGLALLASIVAVAGEHLGITLARHDGIEDCQAGHTGDVGDDVVQLHVHLVEGLLHAQQVLAGGAHEALTVARQ